jgi:hypothetical protein
VCTSCVHVFMNAKLAAPSMCSCMHVCKHTMCAHVKHGGERCRLAALCLVVCACVKPRISLSCIHVRMHEEPKMRPNTCVRRVLMWNQGAKPNVCACHVFICACMNDEERKQTLCVCRVCMCACMKNQK